MIITELRASIKQWEHDFLAVHGHRPTSSDIKSDREIYSLYKQYHAGRDGATRSSASQERTSKTSHLLRTPQKPKSAKILDEEQGESDTEDDDEDASEAKKVTEVFPTPQFQGRVLGLFDIEMSLPETPHKSSPSKNHVPVGTRTPSTPLTQKIVETPVSKRTPDYFLQRVNLFNLTSSPTSNSAVNESPLVKRRIGRTKSVCDIMRETTELREKQQSDQASVSQSQGISPPQDSTTIEPQAAEIMEPESPNRLQDSVPIIADLDRTMRRKPKRQTKRVKMKPVGAPATLSAAKPSENYVRLNINHNNKKLRKRR